MFDVIWHIVFEWLLHYLCYWAGAVAIVFGSAGRYKPGLSRFKTTNMDVVRHGELTYSFQGTRYVYQKWVVMTGVVVWIVVLLSTMIYIGLT